MVLGVGVGVESIVVVVVVVAVLGVGAGLLLGPATVVVVVVVAVVVVVVVVVILNQARQWKVRQAMCFLAAAKPQLKSYQEGIEDLCNFMFSCSSPPIDDRWPHIAHCSWKDCVHCSPSL